MTQCHDLAELRANQQRLIHWLAQMGGLSGGTVGYVSAPLMACGVHGQNVRTPVVVVRKRDGVTVLPQALVDQLASGLQSATAMW